MKKFKVIQATVAIAMAVSMFGLTACDLFTGGNETGDGQTYNVSLNVNGGSLLSELDSYVSGEVTALPNAEKEHYTFGGWYKDDLLSGNTFISIPKSSKGDVEYWAKWTPETYAIKYYIDGKEYAASGYETYTYNVETSLPIVLKDNYSLNGWYENSACTGSKVTSVSAGEYGAKEFYAKWTPDVYNVTLNLNGGKLENGAVFNGYSYGTEKTLPVPVKSGYRFDGWFEQSDFSGEEVKVISAGETGDKTYYAKWTLTAAINVRASGGYEEGAYVEIVPGDKVNINNVSVWYKPLNSSKEYKKIDSELIREVRDADGTYIRADIIGISAGNYSVKVSADGSEVTTEATVTSYDRSGYAHFNDTDGVGGYKNDGTPKDGAYIVYVSEATKNTVVAPWNNSKVGIVSILGDLSRANKPVIIRFLDIVKAATWEEINYTKSDDEKLVTDKIISQTKALKGITLSKKNYTQEELEQLGFKYNTAVASKLNNLTGSMKYDSGKDEFDSCWNDCGISGANNVTLEGIGTSAGLFQWGMTWKKSNSIEIRNLTFDDYTEDACSFEGSKRTTAESVDDFDSKRIWLHNNTFYEGKNYWDVCKEQDKHDGDGSTDFKYCSYITISYDHYVETHKTGLIGGSNDQLTANVTFHHNYYDGCKSRLPLARQANMHMYNNYYHNSTSTSVSLRAYAYALIEYCCFDGPENKMIDIQSFSDSTENSYGVAKLYKCSMEGKGGYFYQNMPSSEKPNGNSAVAPYIVTVTNRYDRVTNNNKFNQNFDTDANSFYYDSVNKRSDVTDLITDLALIKTEIPKLAGVHKN